jgi:hypothetical protein
VAGIYRSCHPRIHRLFSEKELKRDFNSITRRRANLEIAIFYRLDSLQANRLPRRDAQSKSGTGVSLGSEIPNSLGQSRVHGDLPSPDFQACQNGEKYPTMRVASSPRGLKETTY